MSNLKSLSFSLLIVSINWNTCKSGNYTSFPREKYRNAPIADEIPFEFEVHGRKIRDEYAWLRDRNWPNVTDGKILRYIQAENEYAAEFFAPLRAKYHNMYEAYIDREGDYRYPYERQGDWLYYEKHEGDKQYPIHCRKFKNSDAAERVILDVNVIARGHKYTDVKAVTASPDHVYLAYAVDHVGDEKFAVKILHMEENSYLSEEIRGVSPIVVWHERIEGFFYLPLNGKARNDKVLFHFLHRDCESDECVFQVPDELYSVELKKCSSRKYVFLQVYHHGTTESYALDITTMNEKNFHIFLIKEKMPGIFYDVTHAGDKFYARTNLGAKNYKVVAAPESPPFNWDDRDAYVPECENYLKEIEASEKYLAMTYMRTGVPVIKIKRFSDGAVRDIAFQGASYYASCVVTNYWMNEMLILYSALNRPLRTFKYDYESDKLIDLNRSGNDFNPDDYTVKLMRIRNAGGVSGTRQPILVTVFYKKCLFKRDGSNAAFIEGYGAYGFGTAPFYRTKAMALVNQGFVYAIAHVRGGDELGTPYYESAKYLNKKRTFQDFVAVAEALIAKNYTKMGNIAAYGNSAGGILVGAVLNERPDLFKAAVINVPFLDVLNTLLDGSLPFTPMEWTELGNPLKDAQYFEYIKSYSPYENVKRRRYPNILLFSALRDKRVGYWMAAKWVARLRKLNKNDDGNVVVLKTDADSGHLSDSGKFHHLKQLVYELVFIFEIFGIYSNISSE